MNIKDVEYICETIGNLAGVPIRIYKKSQRIYFHSLVLLPKDPICLSQEKIFAISSNIGYYITPYFYFYGIVNCADIKIVIGPSRQIPCPDVILKEIAFKCDVDSYEIDDFVSAMKGIVPMPYETVLQMLCTVNFVLNGEKLTLNDITSVAEQQDLLDQIATSYGKKSQAYDADMPLHNTFDLERQIKDMVRKGDVTALNKWISQAPAIRGGILAHDQIRQYKNTFVVTATVASRAAIQGGMNVDDALTLSDLYIQKSELLADGMAIINLQMNMIVDYAEKVNKLRIGNNPSKLMLDVANYVQRHLTEVITAESIAKALFISRPYLSAKFKEESGMTLTDYVMKEKIEEAKRLLRHSDKTLVSISAYLGFSSQSHFTRAFKKLTDLTPKEYRDKHLK
ncbi:MAG: helix-turn-helix domain-containing protein [Corallococcus sp.]|nr:helix-turn-helix domain-containing protein [Corallococcus sp.]